MPFFYMNVHIRVVTWYMGSGLKAQNMTGIRAQRNGLRRAQKGGNRDHKAFELESIFSSGLRDQHFEENGAQGSKVREENRDQWVPNIPCYHPVI